MKKLTTNSLGTEPKDISPTPTVSWVIKPLWFFVLFISLGQSVTYAQVIWNSSNGTEWLDGTNWTGNGVPTMSQIARFGVNPVTDSVVIDMNGATNNGLFNQAVGAIEIDSARLSTLVIGNSSSVASGTLTINSVDIGATQDIIIRNKSKHELIIQNETGAGNKQMSLSLINNINNKIAVDSAGDIRITSNIHSASGNTPLSKQGDGTLYLLSGGNDYSGGTTINSGILAIAGAGNLGAIPAGDLRINRGTFRLESLGLFSSRNIILGDAASTIDIASGVTYVAFDDALISSVNGGAFTKIGAGTFEMQDSNTYTGLTTVTDGILDLNYSGGNTIPVTNNVRINGGTLRVSSNQTLADLTMSSGTLIVDASATLTVTGTYNVIGGTLNIQGKLRFSGSAASIPGPGVSLNNGTPGTISNLEISTGANITLTESIAVSGTLSLTGGIITTNGFLLSVSNNSPSAVNGGSAISYVNGNLNRSIATGANTYDFPIGIGSVYAPVNIVFSNSNGGTLTGSTTDGDHPSIGSSIILSNQSVNRNWTFTKTGLSIAEYDASFNWDSTDVDASFDFTTAICGKYDGSWTYPAMGALTATSAQINGVSGFSDFEFGNKDPLPIALISFEANKLNDKVIINWQTASEKNNAKFEIQRSSNSRDFNTITEQKGAGNSNALVSYSTIDKNPLHGDNYYRLKQIDFDGNFSYGPVRVVSFNDNSNIIIFPTLVKDKLNIKFNANLNSASSIQLISLTTGMILYQTSIDEGDNIEMDLSALPSGAYIARFNDEEGSVIKKFVKQ